MERKLGGYRLYFLDERGSILFRKDFEAGDDRQALNTTYGAARRFSLTCSGLALWQGKRQVWEGSLPVGETRPAAAEDLNPDTEEVLQRSRWRAIT